MEEEYPERHEEEAEEAAEHTQPKASRRRRVLFVVVVVVLALAGVAAYFLYFSNSPPTASFAASSVDLHLSVDASASGDPDGDTLAYAWSWGDGSAAGSGITAAHDYAAVGTYNVTLTVRDSRGAAVSAARSVLLRILPTAFFLARQSGMTTSFDATGSTASTGATGITTYAWNFGDGKTATGLRTNHTYDSANRYNVTLTVTDTNGLTNSASRYVSANTTTVDILADQYFTSDCPYGGYWFLRHRTYGDIVLNDKTPCTDYYPWIQWAGSTGATNPSFLYTLYHFDARVTNSLGYNVADPVILPVFNSAVAPAPDSYISFNLGLIYLESDNSNPNGIYYWQNHSYSVDSALTDGFGYLLRGTVTMDLTESERIFGVPVGDNASQAQAWWYTNTRPYKPAGAVENATGQWLFSQGNGEYDVYNGFQYGFTLDITDLNATVASNGTTTVRLFWDGWAMDVLLARWFYWGRQDYSKAVTSPYGRYPPLGWMPYETCWCENTTMHGTIRSSLNLSYQGTSEYWFQAVGDPGPDHLLGTPDDLAAWAFSPSLMDYVPPAGSNLAGSSGDVHSELAWYVNDAENITTPGSYGYGQTYEYMVTPDRWNMSLGNTLTLVMPRTPVPWFDPVKSTWDGAHTRGIYSEFNSTMAFRFVTPAGDYFQWDDRGKVLSLAAPAGFTWQSAGLPSGAPLSSAPYIEFGPETTGG